MLLKNEISQRLQWSFIFCAFLIFIIGAVCLYSWHKQNQQIHYVTVDYIPEAQVATRFDETSNALFNEFDKLTQTTNTQLRLSLKESILLQLSTLQQLCEQLPLEKQNLFKQSIIDIEKLLTEVDATLAAYHVVLNQLTELETYLYWLNNDFNQELSALLQDINLQQNFLLNQFNNNQTQSKQHKIYDQLNSIHQEMDTIANLTLTENNLISTLNQLVNKNNLQNRENDLHYLAYLKQNSQSILSQPDSSMITLQQIIQELFKIGLTPNELPNILNQYELTLTHLNQVIKYKDQVLTTIKMNLKQQMSHNHQQLISLSNKMQSASNFSLIIIMVTIAIVILFILTFNQFYIRPKIILRLRALNHSVTELSQGNLQTDIPVYGEDELGRITQLLRQSIAQINAQTLQLKAEIVERISIENNLRMTQDDLIQAAKLAVIGQTITTLAHEINQPLNALSIYVYTAKSALKTEQNHDAHHALEQSQLLIARIKNIITQLRTFSKRSDSNVPQQKVDLLQVINHSWEIVALNKTARLTLTLPKTLAQVLGNPIRYEQVFVNIFTNAIDACVNHQADIIIDQVETDQRVILYVQDNGIGWPLNNAEQLLKPFVTSKEVGLGIGLSLCQSIMQQSQGDLSIASTLDRHALIVLKFVKA